MTIQITYRKGEQELKVNVEKGKKHFISKDRIQAYDTVELEEV